VFKDRYRGNMVVITHRGTKESIQRKIQQGILPANYPKPNNWLMRTLEHSTPCVWVTIGNDNWYNYLMSGMIQYRNLASLTFRVPKHLLKSPDGIVKYPFSGFLALKAQKIIEGDVPIPSGYKVKM
jgi:hypothetical protein